MDPEYLSLLTLTVVPGTPIAALAARGDFALPSVEVMLGELRTIVADSRPTAAVFRTNHASNYLPLEGRLPRDRDRIVATRGPRARGRRPRCGRSGRGGSEPDQRYASGSCGGSAPSTTTGSSCSGSRGIPSKSMRWPLRRALVSR